MPRRLEYAGLPWLPDLFTQKLRPLDIHCVPINFVSSFR